MTIQEFASSQRLSLYTRSASQSFVPSKIGRSRAPSQSCRTRLITLYMRHPNFAQSQLNTNRSESPHMWSEASIIIIEPLCRWTKRGNDRWTRELSHLVNDTVNDKFRGHLRIADNPDFIISSFRTKSALARVIWSNERACIPDIISVIQSVTNASILMATPIARYVCTKHLFIRTHIFSSSCTVSCFADSE